MKKTILGIFTATSILYSSITVDGSPLVLKENGDLLYLITENKIEVINVTYRDNPTNINSLNLNMHVLDATIYDNNLYLVATDGLYIYNIKGDDLILEGFFETKYAQKVYVENNKAYIANYMDGLQIIDITNKKIPKLERFIEYKSANDIYVKDNIAYLCTKNEGLIILDISNSVPIELSKFIVKDFMSMEAKGNYLYFSNKYEGMYIVDISNPSKPTYKKQLHTKATDIKISSNNAYLLNKNLNILEFIDISVPEVPKLINYKEIQGLVSIDSNDNYIYTVDSKGLNIYDKTGKVLYDENSNNVTTIDKYKKTLNAGWNLIGNPTIDNINTKDIKNALVTWVYKDTKWIMNPETINPNIGFWVYNKNMEIIEFNGKSSILDINTINQGWNILSNGIDTINPTINNKDVSISWIYEKGAWTYNPKSIEAGRGFWILKK